MAPMVAQENISTTTTTDNAIIDQQIPSSNLLDLVRKMCTLTRLLMQIIHREEVSTPFRMSKTITENDVDERLRLYITGIVNFYGPKIRRGPRPAKSFTLDTEVLDTFSYLTGVIDTIPAVIQDVVDEASKSTSDVGEQSSAIESSLVPDNSFMYIRLEDIAPVAEEGNTSNDATNIDYSLAKIPSKLIPGIAVNDIVRQMLRKYPNLLRANRTNAWFYNLVKSQEGAFRRDRNGNYTITELPLCAEWHTPMLIGVKHLNGCCVFSINNTHADLSDPNDHEPSHTNGVIFESNINQGGFTVFRTLSDAINPIKAQPMLDMQSSVEQRMDADDKKRVEMIRSYLFSPVKSTIGISKDATGKVSSKEVLEKDFRASSEYMARSYSLADKRRGFNPEETINGIQIFYDALLNLRCAYTGMDLGTTRGAHQGSMERMSNNQGHNSWNSLRVSRVVNGVAQQSRAKIIALQIIQDQYYGVDADKKYPPEVKRKLLKDFSKLVLWWRDKAKEETQTENRNI